MTPRAPVRSARMARRLEDERWESDEGPFEVRLTRRALLAAGTVCGWNLLGNPSALARTSTGPHPRHRHHHHHTDTLPVRHSGASAWVIVNTRGLPVPPGTRLLIDGRDATKAFGFPQPTHRSPSVRLLLPVGRHTFEWGGYGATFEVYWRGHPFTGRTDFYAPLNAAYFGEWPNVARAPGGVDNTAAFQNWAALNNGYSVVPDPAPATSCVFAVAPGDEPFGPGAADTPDTRAELNMTDNYALYSEAVPGSPPGGIDTFGNTSRTVRFWRLDYLLPSSWVAPVPVQNTQGRWAQPPFGTGRGKWQLPPAARGGPRPSRVITNTVAGLKLLNNILETGGPGIIVWSTCNGGEDLCWLYSPSALGEDLPTVRVDVHPLRLDKRENTILECLPQPYCTNGRGAHIYAYGVPPGGPPYGGGYLRTWRRMHGKWICTSAGHPLAAPGIPKIVDGRIVGDRRHGSDAGKIFGPTLRTHADGSLVGGLVASPGINAQRDLSSPLCVREWPLLIGPTFASVSGPPPV